LGDRVSDAGRGEDVGWDMRWKCALVIDVVEVDVVIVARTNTEPRARILDDAVGRHAMEPHSRTAASSDGAGEPLGENASS
jgi:hypothetical protein